MWTFFYTNTFLHQKSIWFQNNDNTHTSGVRQILVNGQQSQTSGLLQALKGEQIQAQPQLSQVLQQTTSQQVDSNKQFVVTPDYIQQSMLIYPSVIVYNTNSASYPMQNDSGSRYFKP